MKLNRERRFIRPKEIIYDLFWNESVPEKRYVHIRIIRESVMERLCIYATAEKAPIAGLL